MVAYSGLETLSTGQLRQLRAEVKRLLQVRKLEAIEALQREFAELAASQGLSVREVFGKSKRGRPAVVKYRDPGNPEHVWTGRGRMPRWMVAAIKALGGTKKDFLI